MKATAILFPESELFSNKGGGWFLAILLGLGLILSVVTMCRDKRPKETLELMPKAAKGKVINDAWGSPFVIETVKSDYYTDTVVISRGPDKKLGTDDDLRKSYRDWKKAKVAGKWVGKKGKDFLKGIKDGVFKKEDKDE